MRLFATLRRYQPQLKLGDSLHLTLEEGTTVEDVLRQLDVPPEEAKVIIVNNRHQSLEYVFRDGDEAGIFPPVGGG